MHPHIHVQPEASVPDPGHPCVSRVALHGERGAGSWGSFVALLLCGLGPSPPGLSFSIFRSRGALLDGPPSPPVLHRSGSWAPAWVPEAAGKQSGRASPGGSHSPHRAGRRAPLGALGRGLLRTGSDETTQMATTWPSKQVLYARTHTATWRGVYITCGLRGAAGGVEGVCRGPGEG